MNRITSIESLEQLYEPVNPLSLTKVARQITPLYRNWIEASRFAILSTIGPEGSDSSPRGDVDPVVQIQDPGTLLLPDWRGNNRLDSLRNIVRDPRISLMFMVPGCQNVVRVNGRAFLTDDPELCAGFQKNTRAPRTVIVISVEEAYFQCAKALMRSRLWEAEDESHLVPSAGDFVKEVKSDFDAEGYDKGYADYAKDRMW